MFTSASSPVVSIQLATTVKDRDDHIVVHYDPAEPRYTNWSVYLRLQNGEAQWVGDYTRGDAGRKAACQKVVDLSIEYQVPVEPIP